MYAVLFYPPSYVYLSLYLARASLLSSLWSSRWSVDRKRLGTPSALKRILHKYSIPLEQNKEEDEIKEQKPTGVSERWP